MKQNKALTREARIAVYSVIFQKEQKELESLLRRAEKKQARVDFFRYELEKIMEFKNEENA